MDLMYSFAAAASVNLAYSAVGIPYLAHRSFMKDFEPSKRAALLLERTIRVSEGQAAQSSEREREHQAEIAALKQRLEAAERGKAEAARRAGVLGGDAVDAGPEGSPG